MAGKQQGLLSVCEGGYPFPPSLCVLCRVILDSERTGEGILTQECSSLSANQMAKS